MFFESQHSLTYEYCLLRHPLTTGDFPIHLHQAFEFYAVESGVVEVCVENKKYILTKNQAVLIFPYQRHSYRVIEKTTHTDCLFSADFAPEFYTGKANLCPQNNAFDFDYSLIPQENGLLQKKSFVYKLLSVFEKNATYEKTQIYGSDLLSDILKYVNDNFCKNCSLKDIAKELGYDYAYISKYFKKSCGMSLHYYVNSLRIGKAQNLLIIKDLPVYAIAEECGFNCLRTFNREFLKQVKQTPNEFRNNYLIK